ncbi:MAG: transglutaminase family protein [Candidatus Diapherotrites archaeon]|nr:transglutaminase family protein [Candidatus Diapherotrites archaeon]
MNAQRFLLVCFFLAIIAGNCFAAEIADPTTIKSMTAKITAGGSGTITGQLNGGSVKIDVLSFSETQNQKVLSLKETLSINGKSISPSARTDDYGNRRAVFEISEAGSFTYQIEAVVETSFGQTALQGYNLGAKIAGYDGYLQPTKNVESNDAKIRTIALNRFDSNSWLQTARDVTAWVHDYLTYDILYYPETYSALQTLESKRGSCDEFSVLAGAMMRAKEVPVRFNIGIVYNGEDWENHAWMQAFNPASGWVDIDPTFGEVGLVDGTHFSRGVFPDPADAVTIEYPETGVSVEENNPVVEMQSVRKFSGLLEMQPQGVSFPAQQWFDLSVTIKNSKNSAIITPIGLGKIEDLQIEERERIILFEPLEEKEITWKIKMNRAVEKNQYLTGKYTVIANLGGKAAEVKFAVKGETTTEKIVSIAAFGSAAESIKIENYKSTPYTVTLNGPGISYETKITVQEGRVIEEPQNQPAGDLPESGLAQAGMGGLLTIENILVVAVVVGIVLILLLLKALLRK